MTVDNKFQFNDPSDNGNDIKMIKLQCVQLKKRVL